ncbi:hypothetical protein CLV42_102126 [Chitinophaga ginsengisoli]|uniref:Tissue inhibitor of metalloproteinase n=1 Tax=Chitinophaga ginsengisoli TaxID=363837 RepID=A0A2P8GKQ7_9BACT|nr:hypothetical protein CLV42_102126 [Chitinophaga ginsengisoli]
MRYFGVLILLLSLCRNIQAQATWECKCDYYSSFDKKSYLSTIDSIVGKIKLNKHEVVQVIGYRAFAAATFAVIVNRNNIMKAYCYNLRTKKYKILTDNRINTWLQCLVRDSSFIHTAKSDPLRMPSHDYGFFVSFKYPSVQLKEICNSVILSNLERPFSTCLKESLDFFDELSK